MSEPRRTEIDPETQAVYVYLSEAQVHHTIDVGSEFGDFGIMLHVDVDRDGKAVGVEII